MQNPGIVTLWEGDSIDYSQNLFSVKPVERYGVKVSFVAQVAILTTDTVSKVLR